MWLIAKSGYLAESDRRTGLGFNKSEILLEEVLE